MATKSVNLKVRLTRREYAALRKARLATETLSACVRRLMWTGQWTRAACHAAYMQRWRATRARELTQLRRQALRQTTLLAARTEKER
jgi:hypothetical protein